MEIFEALYNVLPEFFGIHAQMLMLFGGIVALIMGLLPGLSGTEAMLLLLPFTYRMNLKEAMFIMMSAYAAAFVGGAVTGIFFGVPGSSTNITTVFDGYSMTRKGRAFEALGAASMSSAIGGIISILLVVILMPWIVPVSLLFGPPEWFVFVVFGLVVLSMAGEGKFIRALLSGFLGLLVSCVGMSGITGDIRFTFGSTYLWGGITVIPAFIGLYPIAEAIDITFMQKLSLVNENVHKITSKTQISQLFKGSIETFVKVRAWLLSSIIGWFIGVIPGVGGALANMMGYVLVKETSRDRETFGQGNIEGVIGAEAANNASTGGALIPTLALGIPGSLNAVILLGIFLLHGIQPGTNVFEKHLDVTWIIILAAAWGTVFGSLVITASGWKLASIIYKIDIKMISPIIILVGSIAAYLARNNIVDVILAYIFAIVGYAMKHFQFSRLAFIIALMLGGLFESSYFQAMAIGRGSFKIFIKSPITIILWSLIIIIIVVEILRAKKNLQNRYGENETK